MDNGAKKAKDSVKRARSSRTPLWSFPPTYTNVIMSCEGNSDSNIDHNIMNINI